MINPTARTGGPYAGGGVLSRSPPHTADVAFRGIYIELRQSALRGHSELSEVASGRRRRVVDLRSMQDLS